MCLIAQVDHEEEEDLNICFIVVSSSTMRGSLFGFFQAPLLLTLWLPTHSAASGQLKVVRAAYGDSLTVPCGYPPQFRNSTKYWCKGPIYELCKIVAKTPKRRNRERCAIADDKEAGVFVVTMRALAAADADTYWCVVARPGRNIFTRVKLILASKVLAATSAVPANSTETNKDRRGCWEPLRWLLFLSLLLSLASAHLAAWMFTTTRNVCRRNVPRRNTNIYE